MEKLKTPDAHAGHSPRVPCGCATTPGAVAVACTLCGAHYTNDALSFTRWRCYDCGQFVPLRGTPAGTIADPETAPL